MWSVRKLNVRFLMRYVKNESDLAKFPLRGVFKFRYINVNS
jgi:hypothetical protein